MKGKKRKNPRLAAVADIITFRYVLPGDETETPLSGEGLVAWTQRMQGMGIRITHMSDEDRQRPGDFLSRA